MKGSFSSSKYVDNLFSKVLMVKIGVSAVKTHRMKDRRTDLRVPSFSFCALDIY